MEHAYVVKASTPHGRPYLIACVTGEAWMKYNYHTTVRKLTRQLWQPRSLTETYLLLVKPELRCGT